MSIVLDALNSYVDEMIEVARDMGHNREPLYLCNARRAVTVMAALTNAIEEALLHLDGEVADKLRKALADAVEG